MTSRLLRAWTDYPITALGDLPNVDAPIRACRVLAYDGDKYLTILASGAREKVKSGYVYTRPGRRIFDARWQWRETLGHAFLLSAGGEMKHAPCLSRKQLRALPRSS